MQRVVLYARSPLDTLEQASLVFRGLRALEARPAYTRPLASMANDSLLVNRASASALDSRAGLINTQQVFTQQGNPSVY